MSETSTHSSGSVDQDAAERRRIRRIIFWDNVNIIFKTTGMITWFFIFLLTLLEIKRYFNIDLIPGYDSAVDDVYGAVRSTITHGLGGGH